MLLHLTIQMPCRKWLLQSILSAGNIASDWVGNNSCEMIWALFTLHLIGVLWCFSFHRMTAWENHCKSWNWLSVMSCLNSYASIKRTVRPATKPRMPSRYFWSLCMPIVESRCKSVSMFISKAQQSTELQFTGVLVFWIAQSAQLCGSDIIAWP